MFEHIFNSLEGSHSLSGVILTIAPVFALVLYIDSQRECHKLRHIPTVGFGIPGLTYLTSFKYLFYAKDLMQEGYDRYKSESGIFKIPTISRWVVFVSAPKLVDELRRVPEEILSFEYASSELLQTDYTLDRNLIFNPYHIPIVRSRLTRRLAAVFPDILDEISIAFADLIDPRLASDNWIEFSGLELITNVVCRASNRIFVGLPLCRDPDYVDLNINFSIEVIKTAQILLIFPEPIRSFVAKLFPTNLPNCVRRGVKHIGPLIEERRKHIELFGDDDFDKPNDFLSWVMDEAKDEETSIENLTKRVMLMNFSAVHSSSMSFTHALYQLASTPEVIAPLREELEAVISSEGWSKAGLAKLVKMDSFLHENQRHQGIGMVSLLRMAVKPYIFSDGTVIPEGTVINVPSCAIHSDDINYDDAKTFKPWRFVNEEGTKNTERLVSTSNNYLVFGRGHHACPGRFFAATMLKLLLGLMILNYDVKLEEGAQRPKDWHFGESRVPNPKGKILLRRREDQQ